MSSAEDNQSPELEGGYLLKRDWIEEEPLETEIYGDEVLLLYPKPDAVTEEQRNYMESYLNSFEQTLEADDGAPSSASRVCSKLFR